MLSASSSEASSVTFEERRTFGLTLIASGEDLHVFNIAAVRAASAAEAAGFKKDDIIAGVDDKSAAQLTLGELRDWLTREGERHVFHVTRAGQAISITATIALVSIDRRPGSP